MLPLLLLAAAASAPVRFHYEASEWVNAAYHLACLEDRINCSTSVYRDFWENRTTAALHRQRKAFSAVMARIEEAQPRPEPAPLLPNYASYFPSLRMRDRIVATAARSDSRNACRENLARIIPPSDARVIADAIDGHRRALHHWWNSAGHPAVRSHAAATSAAIKGAELDALAGQIATFVDGSTEPVDAGWMALHELTHALYGAAPPERRRELIRQFAAHPDGQPFSYVLNEALATAVQLIACERLSLGDDDPYDHPYIARRAAREELGGHARNPRFLYSAVAVLTSSGNRAALETFFNVFRPRFLADSEQDWKLFPGLPAVRLVTDDETVPHDGARVIRARDTKALIEAIRQVAATGATN